MNDTVSIAVSPPTVAEQVYILAGRMGDLEHEVGKLRSQCKLLTKHGAVTRKVVTDGSAVPCASSKGPTESELAAHEKRLREDMRRSVALTKGA